MTGTRRHAVLDGLRYRAAGANLARHLGPDPVRVLDLAGGSGGDALPLAAGGHWVTVVDPAGALLDRLLRRAYGLAGRVDVVQARAEDVPALFPAAEFDVVLCHGLLQHVEGAPARVDLLRAATAPLAPGGLLSVIAPAPHDSALAAHPGCTAERVLDHLRVAGLTAPSRYRIPAEEGAPGFFQVIGALA
ncbi:class I SAM-dependent methyltransferase [Actinokineospora pegani]|uniref:class I SAM-dependent methyltransferase n=1 Tax=Actinokineospora pegani TaxID=2654637 RepID=UPI0012E9A16D|nr:class I SAM-dependent methyltransferase [Actinokineospora pegani]